MSEHVTRLRALVGDEMLLLPAVSVLPVDKDGRVLLVQHAGLGETWDILGGGVEVGEAPADAAIRETREACGGSAPASLALFR